MFVRETLTRYVCDVCGKAHEIRFRSEVPEGGAPVACLPDGWVEIRDPVSRHACGVEHARVILAPAALGVA